MRFDNLMAINRNQNGDYYFIFSVNGVVNHIKLGSHKRDEVIIVGVPKNKLVSFLNGKEDPLDGKTLQGKQKL